jgi:hypothetical protein
MSARPHSWRQRVFSNRQTPWPTIPSRTLRSLKGFHAFVRSKSVLVWSKPAIASAA